MGYKALVSDLLLSDLSVGFRKRPLLSNLSLRLKPGDLVALLGPSGCGKSLLLRTIAGLSEQLGGELTLGGRAPADWSWPVWRQRVMLVPQQTVMFAGSVLENLERPFLFKVNRSRSPALEAVEGLARVGLGARYAERRAKDLSVGEQQRVALLRALRLSPDFILLDEPTSALDPAAKELVEELLADRQKHGVGVLIVSHERGQAERLSAVAIDVAEYRHDQADTARASTL